MDIEDDADEAVDRPRADETEQALRRLPARLCEGDGTLPTAPFG